jgi:hypothetical protein
MKTTLGIVLMVCSPFIVGGLFIAAIKGFELYSKWSYQRAVERRNARLVRFGITPFRGTRVRQ